MTVQSVNKKNHFRKKSYRLKITLLDDTFVN